MKKGKFIVLEGGEGAGKGAVRRFLETQFPEMVFTREPGGAPLAEKIRAVPQFPYRYLVRVKLKHKRISQEAADFLSQMFQDEAVVIQNNKVIAVADIVPRFEYVLHIVVKLVQIDIRKKLARYIAERQSLSRRGTK